MQADPLGLVDGASVYGYARQNPLRYVDPRGEEFMDRVGGGGPGGYGVAAGMEVGALGGSAVYIGPTALDLARDLDRYFSQGGNATTQSPYSKPDENDALGFVPDPFGDDAYCLRLKRAINILRAMSAWRTTDLSYRSDSIGGHLQRLARVNSTLKRLEDHYRIVCGGDCPTE